jgi:hypothetical protein
MMRRNLYLKVCDAKGEEEIKKQQTIAVLTCVQRIGKGLDKCWRSLCDMSTCTHNNKNKQ